MFDEKPKYKVLFVRMMNGTPLLVGKKKTSRNPDLVRWRRKEYRVDWTKPLFRQRSVNHYVYDLDEGQMLTAGQRDGIDPALNKAVFKDRLAEQLTNLATKDSIFDISIVGMIILVVLGLAVGIVVSQNLMG